MNEVFEPVDTTYTGRNNRIVEHEWEVELRKNADGRWWWILNHDLEFVDSGVTNFKWTAMWAARVAKRNFMSQEEVKREVYYI